jgi:5-methylthioadenosine/S-adenosylhomocysteine deaminase
MHLALGTDNCALDDNEDYLSELRLGRRLGRTAARSNAGQLRTFFAAATEAGARAAFVPKTGRIEPGYRADLVAIDLSRIRGAYLDPDMPMFEAILARGAGRDVVMTMVGGRVLYQNGCFAEANMEEARRLAEKTAAETRSTPADRDATGVLAEALRGHYRSSDA